jgi:hypothetical protein
MQAQAELALQPLPGLWLAGSAGVFGNEHKREYRTSYALVKPTEWAAFRFGRFLQAAGIGQVDHTDWARRAWELGQGNERYGVEAAVLTPWGEAVLSQGSGPKVWVEADPEHGYERIERTPELTYARASAYLPWFKGQLGASGRWTDGDIDRWGIHALAAPLPWLTLAAEGVAEDQIATTSARLSVAPVKGVELFASHESREDNSRPGFGLVWMPTYGLDVTGHWRRSFGAVRADEWLLVVHGYL